MAEVPKITEVSILEGLPKDATIMGIAINGFYVAAGLLSVVMNGKDLYKGLKIRYGK